MGKRARFVLFALCALALAIAASGSAALADTAGPGVAAPITASP